MWPLTLMKSKILNFLIAITAIGALGFGLYPTVANFINQIDQDGTIVIYNSVIQESDTSTLDEMWKDAKEFNEGIAQNTFLFSLTEAQEEEYDNLLNPESDGLMGYVDIPRQDIHLAIYHGTEDSVLSHAVGHFGGTSLPTDGEDVHTVITGHTGLPNLDLFTDIHDMKIGDKFTITVLNHILTYEVDKIDVVLPEEVPSLEIERGQNYCTLVTCTPYGVNDHRLLVRGTLTDASNANPKNDTLTAKVLQTVNTAGTDLVAVFCYITIAAIALIVIAVVVKAVRGSTNN